VENTLTTALITTVGSLETSRSEEGPVSIMALQVPPPNDRKRVKVYELRENDWFDRGTGFCTGQVVNVSIFNPDGRHIETLLASLQWAHAFVGIHGLIVALL